MGVNLTRNKTSWSIADVINQTGESPSEQFKNRLIYIDGKLDEIKKEISYWDIYNIQETLYYKEDFHEKLTALQPNSSLVINTTSFTEVFNDNNQTFYRGDLIVRDKYGVDHYVPAANSGVYVPTMETEENNTNLKITYNFNTNAPTEDGKYISYSQQIKTLTGENSKTYGFSIPGTYNSSSNFYPFDVIKDGNKPIVPVIKFFDKNNQEVYTDEYALFINTSGETSTYRFYLKNNQSGLIQTVVIK